VAEYGMIKDTNVSWNIPYKSNVETASVTFSDESSIPGVTLGGTVDVSGKPSTVGSYSVSVTGKNSAGTSVSTDITFVVGEFSISDANKLQAYLDGSVVSEIYAGQSLDLAFTPTTDVPLVGYAWDISDDDKDATDTGDLKSADTTEPSLTIAAVTNNSLLAAGATSYDITFDVNAVYGIGKTEYAINKNDSVKVKVKSGFSLSNPDFVAPTESDPIAGAGESATATVGVLDSSVARNYTYQWQYSDGGINTTSWKTIDGATTSTLTLSHVVDDSSRADITTVNMTPSGKVAAGGETAYRCIVNDGFFKVATAPDNLSVNSNVKILATPQSKTVKASSTTDLYVTATKTYGDLTYQWQKAIIDDNDTPTNKNDDTIDKWVNVSDTNNREFNTEILTQADDDTYYRVIASTAYDKVASHQGSALATGGAKVTVVNDWANRQIENAAGKGADLIAGLSGMNTNGIANTWYTDDGAISVYVNDNDTAANNGFIAATSAQLGNAATDTVTELATANLAANDIVYIALRSYLDVPDGTVTVENGAITKMPARSPTIDVYVDSGAAGTAGSLDSTDIQISDLSTLAALDAATIGLVNIAPDLSARANMYHTVNTVNYATESSVIKLTVGSDSIAVGSIIFIKTYTPGVYEDPKASDIIKITL
jgi:hypothetical protein